MARKTRIAVSWAAACGGCDVSLLDLEEPLLELAASADIVYWPVAMDFKREDLLALPDGSVDFGLFNGAVRTSEQVEDAQVFRRKCRTLVAYGACAAFGGIPGLSNLSPRDEILETVYAKTASTENPEDLRPQPESLVSGNGHRLELPVFSEWVRSLAQVVDVDVFLPGCPPPTERVLELVGVVTRFTETGDLPPKGTVLASDKALCDTCPRKETRQGVRMETIYRPHEIVADPLRCFLDQGLLCMGLATRGGCGATCIQANMPCRGCFGPTADMLDPGAEALSAIGSLSGAANENDVQAHEMMKAVRSIRDPAGTFYRYTLPEAFLNHKVTDRPAEEQS